MPGIDHIVICCNDLECTSQRFESLGFNLTPEAKHPWGTKNRLIQLTDSFLELLAIEDKELIPESSSTAFSFGEFNQMFLTQREGGSMVVLTGHGTRDLERFKHAGLQSFELFNFERIATQSDGVQKKVAFELAFTKHNEMSEIGFFTCRNIYPDNFWNSDFQTHSNYANHFTAIYLVAKYPAAHLDFLSGFCDSSAVRVSENHFKFPLDNCTINIVNHSVFSNYFGVDQSELPNDAFVGALEIASNKFEKLKDRFSGYSNTLKNGNNKLIFNNFIGFTTLVFVPAGTDRNNSDSTG